MKKTWIKVKRGLLEPKHIMKLGPAWYLYLYILDNADWETGQLFEWKDKFAADELGKPLGLIRKHRKLLIEEKYISSELKKSYQIITIKNWTDPRKYDGVVINECQGSDLSEPKSAEVVEGSGKGNGKGFSNPSYGNTLPYNHISHNTKEKNSPQKKLDDEFKALHQTIFSGSFNKSWWDVMENAPKELDGTILKIIVSDQKMIDNVNARTDRTQWTIPSCGFQFTSFELVYGDIGNH